MLPTAQPSRTGSPARSILRRGIAWIVLLAALGLPAHVHAAQAGPDGVRAATGVAAEASALDCALCVTGASLDTAALGTVPSRLAVAAAVSLPPVPQATGPRPSQGATAPRGPPAIG